MPWDRFREMYLDVRGQAELDTGVADDAPF